MEKRKIIEALKQARAKIAIGWCQISFAEDGAGNSVDVRSKKACSWCVLGALLASLPRKKRVGFFASLIYEVALAARTVELDIWNDDKRRTKNQVLKAFDKAIARAEKRGECPKSYTP